MQDNLGCDAPIKLQIQDFKSEHDFIFSIIQVHLKLYF